jgi:uncharacterized protein
MSHRAFFFSLLSFFVLAGCTSLDNTNRSLIYEPHGGVSATPASAGLAFRELWIDAPAAGKTPAGRVHAWWLPQMRCEAPTILFMHGRGGNLSTNLGHIRALHSLGLSVLAMDYRGYGLSSPGLPDEPALYADAMVAWKKLRELAPSAWTHNVYGYSLGGAVAIDLATRVNGLHALIAEGTFTSIADVAQETKSKLIPSVVITQRFASVEKIARVSARKLMLHGTQDEIVPFAVGKRLFEAASEPKTWVSVVDSKHENLIERAGNQWRDAIRAVVARPLEQEDRSERRCSGFAP